jgi:hypothetical protein
LSRLWSKITADATAVAGGTSPLSGEKTFSAVSKEDYYRHEAGDSSLQSGMDEVTEDEGIQQKRIVGLAGLIPVESVPPEIAQRIAQQFSLHSRRREPSAASIS